MARALFFSGPGYSVNPWIHCSESVLCDRRETVPWPYLWTDFQTKGTCEVPTTYKKFQKCKVANFQEKKLDMNMARALFFSGPGYSVNPSGLATLRWNSFNS